MIRTTIILALIFLTPTALFTSTALAAEGNPDAEALRTLIPPVSVKGGPISGEGKARTAELVVKSDSDRSISSMVVEILLLRSDGSLSSSFPFTQGGFSGHDGRNTLNRGESHPFKVDSMFIKDDMAAVDGLVREITFTDKSTWPPVPSPPPGKKTAEPVAVKMIGVQGVGDRARAVVACFNFGSQGVKAVHYELEYLDAGGKPLKKTSYGSESNSAIMEVGAGIVISGGDGPPTGTVRARVSLTNVKFSDKSEWNDPGDPSAIEKWTAIAKDPKKRALWYMAAKGLEMAAKAGNVIAIESLAALAADKNQNVQRAAVSALEAAAGLHQPRAEEALRKLRGS